MTAEFSPAQPAPVKLGAADPVERWGRHTLEGNQAFERGEHIEARKAYSEALAVAEEMMVAAARAHDARAARFAPALYGISCNDIIALAQAQDDALTAGIFLCKLADGYLTVMESNEAPAPLRARCLLHSRVASSALCAYFEERGMWEPAEAYTARANAAFFSVQRLQQSPGTRPASAAATPLPGQAPSPPVLDELQSLFDSNEGLADALAAALGPAALGPAAHEPVRALPEPTPAFGARGAPAEPAAALVAHPAPLARSLPLLAPSPVRRESAAAHEPSATQSALAAALHEPAAAAHEPAAAAHEPAAAPHEPAATPHEPAAAPHEPAAAPHEAASTLHDAAVRPSLALREPPPFSEPFPALNDPFPARPAAAPRAPSLPAARATPIPSSSALDGASPELSPSIWADARPALDLSPPEAPPRQRPWARLLRWSARVFRRSRSTLPSLGSGSA
jgi:hypothetical protein